MCPWFEVSVVRALLSTSDPGQDLAISSITLLWILIGDIVSSAYQDLGRPRTEDQPTLLDLDVRLLRLEGCLRTVADRDDGASLGSFANTIPVDAKGLEPPTFDL
jgi:hypothetical protein